MSAIYFDKHYGSTMNKKSTWGLTLILLLTCDVNARPKTSIEHGRSIEGFARMRINNLITKELACYVAIDGFKVKFRLPALNTSRWVTATDTQFNHSNFSTWCDYLSLNPKYNNYRRR